MVTTTTLEARHISYAIGNTRILRDISLAVNPGEMVAVVGPNGAGKSTLLKLLCGDLLPAQGQVLLDEKPLAQWNRRDLAKIRAVLPQHSPLSFAFTVLEVVLMGRTPHVNRVERPIDYTIARQALAAVGLSNLQDRVYTTLSGGEQQRVQLARVLCQLWDGPDHQPRFLLLDEPTASLDLAHQHGTLQIASRFTQHGVGVLAILHDLNLAAQYADRILVLKDGVCVAEGTPEKALTASTIQDVFQVPVMISSHPCYDCPLVIPIPSVLSEIQS